MTWTPLLHVLKIVIWLAYLLWKHVEERRHLLLFAFFLFDYFNTAVCVMHLSHFNGLGLIDLLHFSAQSHFQ